MLATTVSYLNLLENKRHNIVTEGQQDTQLAINQQLANVQAGQLEETKRHNRETEAISWGNLAELSRHNVVTEGINEYDATTRRMQIDINRYDAETRRYAAVQNAGIGWANVAVSQGQLEVSRQRVDNDYEIGSRNAKANLQQAETAQARQQEEVRWHDITRTQNEENINLRSQELEWEKEYQQQRNDLEKMNIIWRNTLDTIDTTTDFFHTLVSDVSSVSDSLRPDSKFIKKRKKGK